MSKIFLGFQVLLLSLMANAENVGEKNPQVQTQNLGFTPCEVTYQNNRYKQAEKVCLASAAKGDEKAMFVLYSLYSFEHPGMIQNKKKAMSWLKQATEHNHIPSMYLYGSLLISGEEGLQKQTDKGMEIIQHGVDIAREKIKADDKDALFQFVTTIKLGGLNTELKREIYENGVLMAAENGHIGAMLAYARYHYELAGGRNDVMAKIGFDWLVKAAETGNAFAKYSLAEAYGVGAGVDKDTQKSEELKKQATQAGYVVLQKPKTENEQQSN